jgi:protein SCO1/2
VVARAVRSFVKPLSIIVMAFVTAYAGGKAYRWQQENEQIMAEYAGYTGGDFTLQSADGKVSLHDFEGRVVLVYFGYTYCPDVCPTSLAVMGEAIKLLDNEANVKGLLISFDPGRDTLDRLKSYAPFFHPEITGLTASAPQILEVSTRYGVYFKKVERDGKDYLMDHTSRIYVIDQQGKLAGVVNHSATPQEVAERVRKLL